MVINEVSHELYNLIRFMELVMVVHAADNGHNALSHEKQGSKILSLHVSHHSGF